MNTGRGFSIVMVFTIMFAFTGVTMTKAELNFEDVEGTWWIMLKQMDKGYIFLHPAVDGTVAKAMKYKNKSKAGYMFIPPESFDGDSYNGVFGIDPDGAGGWMVVPYDLNIYGGTPNDLVGQAEMFMMGLEMVLTVRATLTEDKKNPGTIKSGKVETLGSSLLSNIPPDAIFAGTRDLKAKWIPEDKVPDDVKALIPPM